MEIDEALFPSDVHDEGFFGFQVKSGFSRNLPETLNMVLVIVK